MSMNPRKTFFLGLFSASLASVSLADFVELDISAHFDYDGVATSNELTANVPVNGAYLVNSLGDHAIGNFSKNAYAIKHPWVQILAFRMEVR